MSGEAGQPCAILVLSYFANEDSMACSHHIDDRLDAMLAKGFEPVLLSSICVARRRDLVHIRVPSILPSGLRFELRQVLMKRLQGRQGWRLLRRLLLLSLLPCYALERLFLRLDPTWSWLPLALIQGRRLCRRYRFVRIYSTGGPAVVHLVADRLARWTGIPWVAEVQDPLIHGYCTRSAGEYALLGRVERLLCQRPERMVFLTEGARRATEARAGDQGHGTVIRPGAKLRTGAAGSRADRQFLLAHFGSMGGVRNLATMIRAVEIAVEREAGIEEDLVIHLHGNLGHDDRARLAASPQGGRFIDKGLLPRARAIQAMAACDVLLLIQGVHEISSQTIPSKCYEYLHSGRPVLGLVYRNPELEALLGRLGHLAVAADDPEDLATRLLELRAAWQGDALPRPAASPYTVDAALGQLLAP